jgi:DNA polymerase-3 subunit epsilon
VGNDALVATCDRCAVGDYWRDLRFLEDPLMLVAGFDLETTGVDVAVDRICEIALILQDWDTGAERLRYVRRINPLMKIAAKAMRVHGISDADVMGCPTFDMVAPLVVKMLEKVDLLIGHNIRGFDAPMLIHEFNRCGVPALKRSPIIIDTIDCRGATPDGKMPSLSELCWSLDVDYDPSKAHAADYDVDRTLASCRKAVALGYIQIELPALAAAA